jgi:hypothetical protein
MNGDFVTVTRAMSLLVAHDAVLARIFHYINHDDIVNFLRALPRADQASIQTKLLTCSVSDRKRTVQLSETSLNTLIDWATKYVELHYVTYEGLAYYQRTHDLHGSFGERPVHDPDVVCRRRSYSPVCDAPPEIIPNGPIEYHFSKFKRLKSIFGTVNNILTHPSCNMLQLNNVTGFCHVHHGADHCRVQLDYRSSITINLPCLLSDLVDAFYRIKSHKWDHLVEKFEELTVRVVGNCLVADLSFDHDAYLYYMEDGITYAEHHPYDTI